MISSSLILNTILTVIDSIFDYFINSIINWLQQAIIEVGKIITQVIIGTRVFIKKVGSVIQEISKHYSQSKDGRWKESVVTRNVSESEVPLEILKKARQSNQETDITPELELGLS